MITEVENNIIATLKTINRANYGWQFNYVLPIAENYQEARLRKYFEKTPVGLVGFDGEVSAPKQEGTAIEVTARFKVVIVHSKYLNPANTARKQADNAGIYQMMNDVRSLLSFRPWDVVATTLMPEPQSAPRPLNIGTSDAMLMIELNFLSKYNIPLLNDNNVDLEILDSTWQQNNDEFNATDRRIPDDHD